jgi:hypothetical protein
MNVSLMEWLKLLGPGLLPSLVALCIGLNVTSKMDLWKKQKLIEKRLTFYDETFAHINQLMTYCCRLGGTGYQLSPAEALALKQKTDRAVHIARPLFSDAWFNAYRGLIKACYQEHTGHGEFAKLTVPAHKYLDAYQGDWQPEWANRYFLSADQPFTDVDIDAREKAILDAYNQFVHAMQQELNLA